MKRRGLVGALALVTMASTAGPAFAFNSAIGRATGHGFGSCCRPDRGGDFGGKHGSQGQVPKGRFRDQSSPSGGRSGGGGSPRGRDPVNSD